MKKGSQRKKGEEKQKEIELAYAEGTSFAETERTMCNSFPSWRLFLVLSDLPYVKTVISTLKPNAVKV